MTKTRRVQDYDRTRASMALALYNAGYLVPQAVLDREGYSSLRAMEQSATFISWKLAVQAKHDRGNAK